MSDDYMQNPTLVKTLAASVVACLEAVKAREPDPDVVGAGLAAVQAADLLLQRSTGEGRKVAQAGLVPGGLDILQKLDKGMHKLLYLSSRANGISRFSGETLSQPIVSSMVTRQSAHAERKA